MSPGVAGVPAVVAWQEQHQRWCRRVTRPQVRRVCDCSETDGHTERDRGADDHRATT